MEKKITERVTLWKNIYLIWINDDIITRYGVVNSALSVLIARSSNLKFLLKWKHHPILRHTMQNFCSIGRKTSQNFCSTGHNTMSNKTEKRKKKRLNISRVKIKDIHC